MTKADLYALVAEHYPHQPTKDVAIMCERSAGRVEQIAKGLGLRKTVKRLSVAHKTHFERYWN